MLDRAIARTRTVREIEAKALRPIESPNTSHKLESPSPIEDAIIEDIIRAPKFKRRL
jgi:hypothetical protein